jgi:DNA modification methylase
MGWIVWDKGQRNFSLADGELAWTSRKQALRIFNYSRAAARVEGKCHPTQKPVQLYMYCIKMFTRSGDLVLDPMSGSGTTALACHALNRRFICIEREHKYVEISRNRLKNARMQLNFLNDIGDL